MILKYSNSSMKNKSNSKNDKNGAYNKCKEYKMKDI